MKVGDRVSDRYGEVGTISQLYDDFSAISRSCVSMTGDEWLAAQERPFAKEHLKEMWASIVYGFNGDDGARWSPLSLLTPIS